ncbi:putative membrane protein [Plasmodium gaboni]|uniref:Putative membrane protein n=1 Tax=Plasmodium gaboni TaxID=647221 RepID=A0A151LJ92_9APIC|nr:putative membrane protein [Plasmodium gaboni]KYN99058.1 putative membrane protein [Plasmodium gaboni]
MSTWINKKLISFSEKVIENVIDSLTNKNTPIDNIQNMQGTQLGKIINKVISSKYFFKNDDICYNKNNLDFKWYLKKESKKSRKNKKKKKKRKRNRNRKIIMMKRDAENIKNGDNKNHDVYNGENNNSFNELQVNKKINYNNLLYTNNNQNNFKESTFLKIDESYLSTSYILNEKYISGDNISASKNDVNENKYINFKKTDSHNDTSSLSIPQNNISKIKKNKGASSINSYDASSVNMSPPSMHSSDNLSYNEKNVKYNNDKNVRGYDYSSSNMNNSCSSSSSNSCSSSSSSSSRNSNSSRSCSSVTCSSSSLNIYNTNTSSHDSNNEFCDSMSSYEKDEKKKDKFENEDRMKNKNILNKKKKIKKKNKKMPKTIDGNDTSLLLSSSSSYNSKMSYNNNKNYGIIKEFNLCKINLFIKEAKLLFFNKNISISDVSLYVTTIMEDKKYIGKLRKLSSRTLPMNNLIINEYINHNIKDVYTDIIINIRYKNRKKEKEDIILGRAIIPLFLILNTYRWKIKKIKNKIRYCTKCYLWLHIFPCNNKLFNYKFFKPVEGFEEYGMLNPLYTLGFLNIQIKIIFKRNPLFLTFLSNIRKPLFYYKLPIQFEPLYCQYYSENLYVYAKNIPLWIYKFFYIFHYKRLEMISLNCYDYIFILIFWLCFFDLIVLSPFSLIFVHLFFCIFFISLSYKYGKFMPPYYKKKNLFYNFRPVRVSSVSRRNCDYAKRRIETTNFILNDQKNVEIYNKEKKLDLLDDINVDANYCKYPYYSEENNNSGKLNKDDNNIRKSRNSMTRGGGLNIYDACKMFIKGDNMMKSNIINDNVVYEDFIKKDDVMMYVEEDKKVGEVCKNNNNNENIITCNQCDDRNNSNVSVEKDKKNSTSHMMILKGVPNENSLKESIENDSLKNKNNSNNNNSNNNNNVDCVDKRNVSLNISNGRNNKKVGSPLCDNLLLFNGDTIHREKKDSKDHLDEKDIYICNDDNNVVTSSEKGLNKERIHMNKEKLNYNGFIECSSVCEEKHNMSYFARRIQNMMIDTKEKMKLDQIHMNKHMSGFMKLFNVKNIESDKDNDIEKKYDKGENDKEVSSSVGSYKLMINKERAFEEKQFVEKEIVEKEIGEKEIGEKETGEKETGEKEIVEEDEEDKYNDKDKEKDDNLKKKNRMIHINKKENIINIESDNIHGSDAKKNVLSLYGEKIYKKGKRNEHILKASMNNTEYINDIIYYNSCDNIFEENKYEYNTSMNDDIIMDNKEEVNKKSNNSFFSYNNNNNNSSSKHESMWRNLLGIPSSNIETAHFNSNNNCIEIKNSNKKLNIIDTYSNNTIQDKSNINDLRKKYPYMPFVKSPFHNFYLYMNTNDNKNISIFSNNVEVPNVHVILNRFITLITWTQHVTGIFTMIYEKINYAFNWEFSFYTLVNLLILFFICYTISFIIYLFSYIPFVFFRFLFFVTFSYLIIRSYELTEDGNRACLYYKKRQIQMQKNRKMNQTSSSYEIYYKRKNIIKIIKKKIKKKDINIFKYIFLKCVLKIYKLFKNIFENILLYILFILFFIKNWYTRLLILKDIEHMQIAKLQGFKNLYFFIQNRIIKKEHKKNVMSNTSSNEINNRKSVVMKVENNNNDNMNINDENININDDNMNINDDNMNINGDNVNINGDNININGDSVNINGDNVNINDDNMNTNNEYEIINRKKQNNLSDSKRKSFKIVMYENYKNLESFVYSSSDKEAVSIINDDDMIDEEEEGMHQHEKLNKDNINIDNNINSCHDIHTDEEVQPYDDENDDKLSLSQVTDNGAMNVNVDIFLHYYFKKRKYDLFNNFININRNHMYTYKDINLFYSNEDQKVNNINYGEYLNSDDDCSSSYDYNKRKKKKHLK